MTELPLFGGPADAPIDRGSRRAGRARILITVKAAPNPSTTHGETVCVAGLRLDTEAGGWVRLYPINFRALTDGHAFKKYDVVSVDITPQHSSDSRVESFRPDMTSIQVATHLPPWKKRESFIRPFIVDNTCDLQRAAKLDPNARSLGAVRPTDIDRFEVIAHPGWTPDQQGKINQYVSQLTLFGDEDRSPLQAPRFQGRYHYRCAAGACGGHEQSLIDWEFVGYQR